MKYREQPLHAFLPRYHANHHRSYPVYSASQLRNKAMRKLKVPAVPADTKTAGIGEVQYSPLDALKNRTISACE
jgi:hypothetical protein